MLLELQSVYVLLRVGNERRAPPLVFIFIFILYYPPTTVDKHRPPQRNHYFRSNLVRFGTTPLWPQIIVGLVMAPHGTTSLINTLRCNPTTASEYCHVSYCYVYPSANSYHWRDLTHWFIIASRVQVPVLFILLIDYFLIWKVPVLFILFMYFLGYPLSTLWNWITAAKSMLNFRY